MVETAATNIAGTLPRSKSDDPDVPFLNSDAFLVGLAASSELQPDLCAHTFERLTITFVTTISAQSCPFADSFSILFICIGSHGLVRGEPPSCYTVASHALVKLRSSTQYHGQLVPKPECFHYPGRVPGCSSPGPILARRLSLATDPLSFGRVSESGQIAKSVSLCARFRQM